MKHYLWIRRREANTRKPPNAAWTLVCKAKKEREGGLGVLNLKTQNEALLLKKPT